MQKLYSKLQHELSEKNLSREIIERFSSTAPNRYKVYTIPKRTSGKRVIAHPSRELKSYQRALIRILQEQLPQHKASYAYKPKCSIRENALMHSKNKFLLKMDFNDFFNSITPSIFLENTKKSDIIFSDAEKRLLTNLLFWNKTKSFDSKLVLSVGAPSSPIISNFIMFKFDEIIYQHCIEKKITYTRYADDLTFSTNLKNELFILPTFIKHILGEAFDHKITINESKTIFSSKAHNRHVTGITITNDGGISIGRERKRMISVMIHKYSINKLPESDFNYLRGLLSFSNHIEPNFTLRLKKKYGIEILNNISKGKNHE
tara:strand:+ start:2114 stop:3067 length:954 start_codon:yes stop_codon:yes gene_type:complete